MNATEPKNEDVTMGIRLPRKQREKINEIAKRQFNTAGGIIRLAVQQLIDHEEQVAEKLPKRAGRNTAKRAA